jgi:hypothetical protein
MEINQYCTIKKVNLLIKLLAKLGIYQFKVFINQHIKMKGNYKEMNLYSSFLKGGYLYNWQYKNLVKRCSKKIST